MKTTLLAAVLVQLNIAKETGLLLNFNFGKLHIQGQSQSISISQDTGAVSKSDLIEVDRLIDFEKIDMSKLKDAVLSSVDSELFSLKTDDLERLVSHQFKQVCTTVAFKALNTKCVSTGHVTESERLVLTKLNNADKFMSYLLPVVLCEETAVKRAVSASIADSDKALQDLGITPLLQNVQWDYIRYATDNGLTCWIASKDWKILNTQRTNVNGKVGYLLNGTIQVTLNDATRTKETEDGDEVITHRQIRFSKVIGA